MSGKIDSTTPEVGPSTSAEQPLPQQNSMENGPDTPNTPVTPNNGLYKRRNIRKVKETPAVDTSARFVLIF